MPSNSAMKEIFEAHPLLSASLALLIEEAVAEGLDADGDFSTAIIAGSNGFFVMLDHDKPVVIHKTHEGLAFPIQIVGF